MNADTDRCSGVFSNCGVEEWRERVPPEHYCLGGGMCFLEGSRDKTQFPVPNRKSQTTDGSCCRGKRATAIEWEREGEREGGAGENEGGEEGEISEMLQRSADSWVALTPIQPHKKPEGERFWRTSSEKAVCPLSLPFCIPLYST